MAIFTQQVGLQDGKREVRLLRQAARKVMVSREAALRFLVSTGMYTAQGQLKRQFR